MKVSVPQEVWPGENRVALVPESIKRLAKKGIEVVVQAGAGAKASFLDQAYRDVGATVEGDVKALYEQAEVILKVQRPTDHPSTGGHEVELCHDGQVLIAFLQPLTDHDLVRRLADRKVTALSMDAVPRITRAQSMDALSSMSNIAGYKAVLIGASLMGKFFPMMMTAAGTIAPGRVFVLGAGVAGLQAIATARRLGAVVEAFDMRPVVKEQVESLGGKFVELEMEHADAETAGGYAKEQSEEVYRREQELLGKHCAANDVVITTALVPGKKAPVLITEDMVKGMHPGSVIVDLAAEQGGNCALSEAGREVVKHDVTIAGPVNLPSGMPVTASQMYSRNISTLLMEMYKDEKLTIDTEDEIVKGALITRNGEVVHAATQEALGAAGASA